MCFRMHSLSHDLSQVSVPNDWCLCDLKQKIFTNQDYLPAVLVSFIFIYNHSLNFKSFYNKFPQMNEYVKIQFNPSASTKSRVDTRKFHPRFSCSKIFNIRYKNVNYYYRYNVKKYKASESGIIPSSFPFLTTSLPVHNHK